MKRTKTKFGPDATFQKLLDKCFGTMSIKTNDTEVEHWFCKRCPRDKYVHQAITAASGTRKRAHILGGELAKNQRIKACEGIDETERNQLIELYQNCARSSKKVKTQNIQDTISIDQEPILEKNQQSITLFTKDSDAHVVCNEALVEFFVDCGIPFHNSNHPSLQKFVNNIQKSARYSLPAPKKLARELLDNLYEKTQNSVCDTVSSLKQTCSSLTLIHDGGQNINEDSLCNMIVGAPRGYALLGCKDLLQKTGEGIADVLDNCVRGTEGVKWKEIKFVTSDNASNCISAVDVLQQQYPHISHIPCHLHVGGLIFKDLIQELVWYEEVLDTMRKIIHVVTRHYEIKQLYEELSKDDPDANGVKLVKPSNTRIATGFFVAERIWRCSDVLRAVVVHPKFRNFLQKEKRQEVIQRANFVKEQICKDEYGFWEKIQLIIDLTEPIIQFIKLNDQDQCQAMEIYRMWSQLRQKIIIMSSRISEENQVFNQQVNFEKIKQIVDTRWCKHHRPIFAAAYALNPKNWIEQTGDAFSDETVNMDIHEGLQWCLEKFCPETKLSVLLSQYQILTDPVRGVQKNFNLQHAVDAIDDIGKVISAGSSGKIYSYFEWFVHFEHVLKKEGLDLIAFLGKICSSPVTTAAACERNWSIQSWLHNSRRNRLTKERSDKLVYCYQNRQYLSKQYSINYNSRLLYDFEQYTTDEDEE